MSALTQPAFEAKYNSSGSGNFPDNTSQLITPTKVREFAHDIADTFYSSIMRTVTVSVSSAELLALFTTPKTLIAAQGASTFIDVISAHVSYDRGAASYAGAAVNDNWIDYNAPSNSLHNTSIVLNSAFDSTTKIVLDDQTEYAASVKINTPIVLANHSGNPTTGDGTLKVYLTYRVLTL